MRASANHEIWARIAPEITPGEFNDPYSMHVETLARLSRVRRISGVPFRFVSDHRPPDRNAAAGGAQGSAHMTLPCRAVDLRVHNSHERMRIVWAAILEGFRRIGVYSPTPFQAKTWGKNAGSLHLDDSPAHAQNVMWVSS